MQEQKQEVLSFNSFELIYFIQKYFWTVMKLTALGAIISVIASLIITPQYKAKAVLFATAVNSRYDITDGYKSDNNSLAFGTENNLDQMMQVLNSNYIRNKIIDKYYLNGAKNIPAAEMQNLILDYAGNVQARRTEYLAAEINVTDPNPQKAAAIANEVCALYDSAIHIIQAERAKKAYEFCEQELKKAHAAEKVAMDSLEILSKEGISDFKYQAQYYSKYHAKELAKGNTKGANVLMAELKRLAVFGNLFDYFHNKATIAREHIQDLEERASALRADLEAKIPNKFVVDKAEVPLVKSSPIRWLIVVTSTLSTFIFSVLLLAIFQNMRVFFKHLFSKEKTVSPKAQ